MNDTEQSWKKFLHPETLKGNLVAVSLFITSFEMFKDAVVQKPKTFFTNGFDKNGPIVGEEYKTEVLSKSKSPLYASLLWFKEMGAINNSDIEAFNTIRKHRNELAHEILEFITNANKNLDTTIFQTLIQLLSKIEKWWFVNFELAINPDIAEDDVNLDEVIPGPIWSLQLMLDIALGNEPEEGYYYKAFEENKPNK